MKKISFGRFFEARMSTNPDTSSLILGVSLIFELVETRARATQLELVMKNEVDKLY